MVENERSSRYNVRNNVHVLIITILGVFKFLISFYLEFWKYISNQSYYKKKTQSNIYCFLKEIILTAASPVKLSKFCLDEAQGDTHYYASTEKHSVTVIDQERRMEKLQKLALLYTLLKSHQRLNTQSGKIGEMVSCSRKHGPKFISSKDITILMTSYSGQWGAKRIFDWLTGLLFFLRKCEMETIRKLWLS